MFGGIAAWLAVIVSWGISGRILYRTASIALAGRFTSPIADQWDQIPFVIDALEGRASASLFWAQHNEHRIPLFRLLDTVDARFFNGTGQFLLILNWVLALATALVLALLTCQVSGVRWRTKLLSAAVISGCIFSATQMENLGFPMGSTNLAVCFFAVATFAGIAFAGQPGASILRWVLPITAALLDTGSLASGVLIWPLAGVMILTIGSSWRVIGIWTVAGIVVITTYMTGYHSPDYLGSPANSLKQSAALIDYVLLYFGGPLSSLGAVKSAAAGIVVLALFFTAVSAVGLHDRKRRLALIALMATGGFIVGTALLTAAGRLSLGAAQAQQSRYQTPVLIFWSVSLVLLLSIQVNKGTRHLWVKALQLALPVFMLFCLLRVEPSGAWLPGAAFQIRQTGIAVALDITDPPKETFGGVPRGRVMNYRPLLARYTLAMFYEAKRLGIGARLTDRFKLAPRESCVGYVDELASVEEPRDGRRVGGWAWDYRRKAAPDYIVFTRNDETIVGWAQSGADRPDVLEVLRNARGRLGFGGYAHLPPDDRLRAYAVDLSAGTACPIGP